MTASSRTGVGSGSVEIPLIQEVNKTAESKTLVQRIIDISALPSNTGEFTYQIGVNDQVTIIKNGDEATFDNDNEEDAVFITLELPSPIDAIYRSYIILRQDINFSVHIDFDHTYLAPGHEHFSVDNVPELGTVTLYCDGEYFYFTSRFVALSG